MDAYIYAWNPSKWKWIDLSYAVSIVNSGEKYYGQWSCGRSQNPSTCSPCIQVVASVRPIRNRGVNNYSFSNLTISPRFTRTLVLETPLESSD